MKEIIWLGSSLDDIKQFPDNAKRQAGFQLHKLQHGDDPSDWKPMKSIGPGVREIRVHEEGEYRVIYVAKIADQVHVLHAFQKKTQKTPQRDLELAKRRLREIVV